MRIGLINIEPKIFNTAYMQIAAFHRARGDNVEWWTPLTDHLFDHVYCSSLFDFTDKSEVSERAICGGTGFSIGSRLSVEMEACEFDYSIYPKCRKSYLWFSRGCPRKCPWCVVPQKEGPIHTVPLKNLNPNGEYIVIQDNNFFANKDWRFAVKYLLEEAKEPVDFQGVDVRILTEEMCQVLNKLKHYKISNRTGKKTKAKIKIAWDSPRENLIPKIKQVIRWIKPYKLMCYVLIGYSSTEEEDLYRVETLRGFGIDPFVMPFDKTELYQRTFARWVNDKAIFYNKNPRIKWEDYKYRVYKQEAAGTGWANK